MTAADLIAWEGGKVPLAGNKVDTPAEFGLMLVLSLLFLTPGLILATNFRRWADLHLFITIRLLSDLGVRGHRRIDPETVHPLRLPRGLRWQWRIIGVAFTAAGLFLVVQAVQGLLSAL